MSYVNDERLANEALQWWQRYPDSVQALVSMLDDTATDEHGNVLGSVSWHHENGLEITLAGSNGLLYSTRKARKDDGWHVFHLVADEKELQKRLKRRLQWSNEADKISSEMTTHSNETGNANMTTFQKIIAEFNASQCLPIMELETKNDYVTVTLSVSGCQKGMLFELDGDYDLADEVYFSGEVEAQGGGVFFYPFDEYFDSVDHYLQEIYMEVQDGYISANDKMKIEE